MVVYNNQFTLILHCINERKNSNSEENQEYCWPITENIETFKQTGKWITANKRYHTKTEVTSDYLFHEMTWSISIYMNEHNGINDKT